MKLYTSVVVDDLLSMTIGYQPSWLVPAVEARMLWVESKLQAEVDAGMPLGDLGIAYTTDYLTCWVTRGERKYRHDIKLTPDLGGGKTPAAA